MWITSAAETALLLHFTTFVLPMQGVAIHMDYKALYEESQLVITQLSHELDQLKKMIFDSKQERFIPGQLTDPTQLSMGLPAEQVTATSLIKAKKIEYTRIESVLTNPVTTHQGPIKLPDHLERKEILVDVVGKEGCREIGRDYATDGKLNIDNNPVENCIRPVAVGRKNYLFAGSHEAAQRSAMLYSLMGTCKLHDINPFTRLRDILKRIAQYPVNKISDLLPHHCTFSPME